MFRIIIGDACQYAGALTIGLRPAQVCQSRPMLHRPVRLHLSERL
ncbi:MAG: hypothetical protein ACLSHC_05035 [Bilophila wadsworthia]